MPIIDSSNRVSILAAMVGGSDYAANLSGAVRLSASFAGGSQVTANITGGYDIITFNGSSSVYAHISSPNIQPITFNGSSSVEAQLTITRYDAYELRFAIDILPYDATPATLHPIWLPRLKVEGVEVDVVNWQFTESKDSASADFTAELADDRDRAKFTAGAEIEFGIGRRTGGAWDAATFVTLFSSGEISSRDLSVTNTQTISVRIGPELSQKLIRTPERDLVIYDPQKQTLDVSRFDILYDTEGRQYITELYGIPGMTLYSLLRHVLVTRCGFSDFRTNLPDFPIARIDCPIGKGFLESIRGSMGVFSPVVFADGDVIWFVDTSIAMPAGFPAARTVSVSDYRAANVSDTARKLDGLIVNYTEDKAAFDFVTTRTETREESTGIFGQSGYTLTSIERGFREYRKFAQPAIVLRNELYYEQRTTRNSFDTIGVTREDYEFDSMARLSGRTKRVSSLLPNLDNPDFYTLTDTSVEREALIYAIHPYQPRSQYVQTRTLEITGLIAIDGENPQLGKDFEREFTTAHRSGNLAEGMTTRFGAIRTVTEDAEPKRDGQVTIRTCEIDHLSNAVITDQKDDRPGDVSMYGTQPVQNRILVLDDENATRSTGFVETISVGELPLLYAIPLARRILKNRKYRSKDGRADVIGYDRGLRKGIPVSLVIHNGEVLGNFLIIGRTISGSAEGVDMQLEVVQI